MRYSRLNYGVAVVLALICVIVAIVASQMRLPGFSGRPHMVEPLSSFAVSEAGSPPTEPQVDTSADSPAASGSTVRTSLPSERAVRPPAGVPAPESVVSSSPAQAVAQTPRFAVEFGPFLSGSELEKAERRLNETGYQTVRFRQRTGAALYAVFVEPFPRTADAEAQAATLRQQGFPEPVILRSDEGVKLRVGDPLLLRAAVLLAESLRARGHGVRVATQPGEAQTFVLRHGNFVSRADAEVRGSELERLGLPNYVVRAK